MLKCSHKVLPNFFLTYGGACPRTVPQPRSRLGIPDGTGTGTGTGEPEALNLTTGKVKWDTKVPVR
jgi:hypothetical protein